MQLVTQNSVKVNKKEYFEFRLGVAHKAFFNSDDQHQADREDAIKWLTNSLSTFKNDLNLWVVTDVINGNKVISAPASLNASALKVLCLAVKHQSSISNDALVLLNRTKHMFMRDYENFGFKFSPNNPETWFCSLLIKHTEYHPLWISKKHLTVQLDAISALLDIVRLADDDGEFKKLTEGAIKTLHNNILNFVRKDHHGRHWLINNYETGTILTFGISPADAHVYHSIGVVNLQFSGNNFDISIEAGRPGVNSHEVRGPVNYPTSTSTFIRMLLSQLKINPLSLKNIKNMLSQAWHFASNNQTFSSDDFASFQFWIAFDKMKDVNSLHIKWKPLISNTHYPISVYLLTEAKGCIELGKLSTNTDPDSSGYYLCKFPVPSQFLTFSNNSYISDNIPPEEFCRHGHFRNYIKIVEICGTLKNFQNTDLHGFQEFIALTDIILEKNLFGTFCLDNIIGVDSSFSNKNKLIASIYANYSDYCMPPFINGSAFLSSFRSDLVTSTPLWINSYIWLRHGFGKNFFLNHYLENLQLWKDTESTNGNVPKLFCNLNKTQKQNLKYWIWKSFSTYKSYLLESYPNLYGDTELLMAHITNLVHGHFDYETCINENIYYQLNKATRPFADCRFMSYAIAALASLFDIHGQPLVMDVKYVHDDGTLAGARHVVYFHNGIIFDGQTNLKIRVAKPGTTKIDFSANFTSLISNGNVLPGYNRFLTPENRIYYALLGSDPGVISFFYYWYFTVLAKADCNESATYFVPNNEAINLAHL